MAEKLHEGVYTRLAAKRRKHQDDDFDYSDSSDSDQDNSSEDLRD